MNNFCVASARTGLMNRYGAVRKLWIPCAGLCAFAVIAVCTFTFSGTGIAATETKPAEACNKPEEGFYVYFDADYQKNHFTPSGKMGDCGDIEMNEACEEKPHSGKSCIRVVYTAKGKGPNECDYPAPCKWAGVYWQYPPNNWGKEKAHAEKGFDLSQYKRLIFWARADKDCRIEFKAGGMIGQYGDSLKEARVKNAKLTTSWQKCEIDLDGADLSHIIGGFCWVTNWNENSDGITFYLDDIRYE